MVTRLVMFCCSMTNPMMDANVLMLDPGLKSDMVPDWAAINWSSSTMIDVAVGVAGVVNDNACAVDANCDSRLMLFTKFLPQETEC